MEKGDTEAAGELNTKQAKYQLLANHVKSNQESIVKYVYTEQIISCYEFAFILLQLPYKCVVKANLYKNGLFTFNEGQENQN